ncbi:hypothetical protein FE848_18565 [Marinobacter sp. 1-3A]|uniref:hypothetical protein n=1 Tax=Marinobacter sp. 1-3A TaxID=2582920 RepID=UPI001903D3E2|nr:hypothetical protein [Marinobacter sp. 1-3A]MBK1875219.1 hypothetical protein [Marinobacter sp. 1-3A]
MFERSTIKILLVFLTVYAGIWLPYIVLQGNLPASLSAPYALLGFAQAIPAYILNSVGISGLIQNDGYCGWGWCGPTVFGYVVLSAFWVLVAWFIAWLISNLTNAGKGRS